MSIWGTVLQYNMMIKLMHPAGSQLLKEKKMNQIALVLSICPIINKHLIYSNPTISTIQHKTSTNHFLELIQLNKVSLLLISSHFKFKMYSVKIILKMKIYPNK